MKKIMFVLALLNILLTGCDSVSYNEEYNDKLIKDIALLEEKKAELQEELIRLDSIIAEKKIEKGVAEYVVVINVAQKHYNLEDMVKDSMNQTQLEIATTKEFYDSVEKGDVLDDSVRMGSLAVKGSYGSWDITISDKYIK